MLRSRPSAFVLPALLSVLRSPARLERTVRLALGNLTGGGRERVESSGEAHLLQIAVDDAWRGKGVADLLVLDFLAQMSRRGATRVRLGVEEDNARAIAFYRRMGFSEVQQGIYETRLGSTAGATSGGAR
jgi:ribosomal protein S18 acetylase RimI-like enzyme